MYVTKCVPDADVVNSETNPFWSLPLSLKDHQESTFHVVGSRKIHLTILLYIRQLSYCELGSSNF